MVEKSDSKKSDEARTVKLVSLFGLVLSSLGILDGIYLTIAHYTTKITLACPATTFVNCEKVTTSSYSVIFGVPLALLGLIFFTVMFFFQLPVTWRAASKLISWARILFSVSGMLMVFWLVFVELDRLNSICLYCTASHILAFGLFVTTLIGTSLISSKAEEQQEQA